MEIFTNLGVDWRILIAQIINFLILLWVLRHFVYRPLLDFLEKRTATIEQGLRDAETARQQLIEGEAAKADILAQAKREAQESLRRAQEQADALRQQLVEKAEADAATVLEQARQSIEAEKQRMLIEAKQELADIVLLATEKVLQEQKR